MAEIIYVNDKHEIEELGSALTLEGLVESDVDKFFDWIEEYTPVKKRRAYVISGDVMNRVYELTESNRYPDYLCIVSIKLDDMEDFNKIVMPRFEIGARWLDDIIQNNLDRENRS